MQDLLGDFSNRISRLKRGKVQFRPGPRDAFIKAELGWAGQSNRISRYSETPVPWLLEAVETQLKTLNSNIVPGRNMMEYELAVFALGIAMV